MSSYLPLLDELCCRTAFFIKSCLVSDSPVVSTVARYGIYCGCINSHLGGNAFFCCSRYDVTDILSVTRHMVSHYVNSYISTQHRASVLLLLRGKSGPALGGTEYRLMPSACRLIVRQPVRNLQFRYLVSRAPMRRRSIVVCVKYSWLLEVFSFWFLN